VVVLVAGIAVVDAAAVPTAATLLVVFVLPGGGALRLVTMALALWMRLFMLLTADAAGDLGRPMPAVSSLTFCFDFAAPFRGDDSEPSKETLLDLLLLSLPLLPLFLLLLLGLLIVEVMRKVMVLMVVSPTT
jgi:hypothetical protein